MHANVCKCRGHLSSHFKMRVSRLIQSQWRLHSKSTTDGDNWPDRQQSSSRCSFTMGQIVKFNTLVKQACFARNMGKMGVFPFALFSVWMYVSVFSSGAGLQRTESSGDHHHCVRGCPHHAALYGSRTADLEKVNMNCCRSQIYENCHHVTQTRSDVCVCARKDSVT